MLQSPTFSPIIIRLGRQSRTPLPTRLRCHYYRPWAIMYKYRSGTICLHYRLWAILLVMDYPIQTSSQLSEHLKSLRKEKGLTQTQLGQLLGIGQARVADIEKNPGLVRVDQLLQILHALDDRLALKVRATTPKPDS